MSESIERIKSEAESFKSYHDVLTDKKNEATHDEMFDNALRASNYNSKVASEIELKAGFDAGVATAQIATNIRDANQHLEKHREVYEQAAIEDAIASGHDVNFGSEHYPAQTPEAQK